MIGRLFVVLAVVAAFLGVHRVARRSMPELDGEDLFWRLVIPSCVAMLVFGTAVLVGAIVGGIGVWVVNG